MPPRYARSPHWTLTYEGGELLLRGGADALFAIEDVPERAAAEILDAWKRDAFAPAGYSLEARDAFEQLLAARAVVNTIAAPAEATVALRFVGAPAPRFADELRRQLPAGVALGERADLVVLVRTNGLLADLAAAADPASPQLLLDLAYEHTISLGPLVFHGDTACLSCFAARVTASWGDAEPPQEPAICRHPALAAGVLAIALDNALTRADRTLVNTTVAYDFATHRVTRNSVYKLPLCPTCGADASPAGAFALPWAASR